MRTCKWAYSYNYYGLSYMHVHMKDREGKGGVREGERKNVSGMCVLRV